MQLSSLSFNLAILSLAIKIITILSVIVSEVNVLEDPIFLILWGTSILSFDLSGILVGLVLGMERFAPNRDASLVRPFRTVGKILLSFFSIVTVFSMFQMVLAYQALTRGPPDSSASYISISVFMLVPFVLSILLIPMFLLVNTSPEVIGSSTLKYLGATYFGLNVFTSLFLLVGISVLGFSTITEIISVVLLSIWSLLTRSLKNLQVSYEGIAMQEIGGQEAYDL